MMRRRSKDDDDDHECLLAKTTSIDCGGGGGARNDKVVTSNLAFAQRHPYPSAAAGITFFLRLMKNGEDKQCGISLGGQMMPALDRKYRECDLSKQLEMSRRMRGGRVMGRR